MPASRAQRLGIHLSVVLMSVFASFASAQTSNTVLLEALDKSVSVSGELVEAANGQYEIKTSAGTIGIDINAVICTGEACPPVLPIFQSGAAVDLTSSDGEVRISGNIAGITDDHYVVDNDILGIIQISIDSVECAGPGCPTGLRFANDSFTNDSVDNESVETIDLETEKNESDNNNESENNTSETTPSTPQEQGEQSPDTETPVDQGEKEAPLEAPEQQAKEQTSPKTTEAETVTSEANAEIQKNTQTPESNTEEALAADPATERDIF